VAGYWKNNRKKRASVPSLPISAHPPGPARPSTYHVKGALLIAVASTAAAVGKEDAARREEAVHLPPGAHPLSATAATRSPRLQQRYGCERRGSHAQFLLAPFENDEKEPAARGGEGPSLIRVSARLRRESRSLIRVHHGIFMLVFPVLIFLVCVSASIQTEYVFICIRTVIGLGLFFFIGSYSCMGMYCACIRIYWYVLSCIVSDLSALMKCSY
jgi:hypothetical protein